MTTRLILLLVAALPGAAPPLSALSHRPAPDTLRLGPLQAAAVARDPRSRQLDLLGDRSALRLANLRSEWLPGVDMHALAQYQSEVASLPFASIPGIPALGLHKDSYDAYLGIRQPLLDPTLGPRRATENAQLAESRARVETSLYPLRQSVADAYFAALLLGAQRDELEAGLTDLEAQLRLARERVAAGDALPSEPTTLQAELLRRRQSLDQVTAERDAALSILGDLTGAPVADTVPLALPDLGSEVAAARTAIDGTRSRPEYAQFARSQESLDRQTEEIARREWPRVSAVGRLGFGRPGLNPLGDRFTGYWLAGIRLEWSPWDWGRSEREQRGLAIQREIIATEREAFTAGIRRAVARDLATIDRLERDLVADEEIIALRDSVLRETRLRHGEGVVTSAFFIDRETDALAARLARATHRVELAQARARFLTFLGIEVR